MVSFFLNVISGVFQVRQCCRLVSNISKENNAVELSGESRTYTTFLPAGLEFPSERISSHEEGEMKFFIFYWTRLNAEDKRIADYIMRNILLECLLCCIDVESLPRNFGSRNVFKQEHDC
jgi:hypothetical protein